MLCHHPMPGADGPSCAVDTGSAEFSFSGNAYISTARFDASDERAKAAAVRLEAIRRREGDSPAHTGSQGRIARRPLPSPSQATRFRAQAAPKKAGVFGF